MSIININILYYYIILCYIKWKTSFLYVSSLVILVINFRVPTHSVSNWYLIVRGLQGILGYPFQKNIRGSFWWREAPSSIYAAQVRDFMWILNPEFLAIQPGVFWFSNFNIRKCATPANYFLFEEQVLTLPTI